MDARDGSGGEGGDDSGGTEANEDKFGIGGKVSGLKGTGMVLSLNDDEKVNVKRAVRLLSGQSSRRVRSTKSASVPSQASPCRRAASYTAAATEIDSVRIACTDVVKHSIGGSVTGLGGGAIKLKNNGGDELTVKADGGFNFTTGLAPGASYNVTTDTAPPGRRAAFVALR